MLLKKYAALEAENKRLKATIAAQDKTTEALAKKLASLERGMVSVQIGNSPVDEEDKENMRRQLDQLIADIDNILVTLND